MKNNLKFDESKVASSNEWKGDKRNGQGTFTWPDGQKYFGEFKGAKATSSQDSVCIH